MILKSHEAENGWTLSLAFQLPSAGDRKTTEQEIGGWVVGPIGW